jgi:hypothetical protein
MSPGTVIGVVLAAGIAAGLVVLVVVAWRSTTISWKPLPGWPEHQYRVEGPLPSPERIEDALRAAVATIKAKGPWAAVDVDRALAGVRVNVAAEPTFPNPLYPQNVGAPQTLHGLQVDDAVKVGVDLLALPHELMHRCLQVLEGDLDPGHTRWTPLGLYAVELAFTNWLTSKGT